MMAVGENFFFLGYKEHEVCLDEGSRQQLEQKYKERTILALSNKIKPHYIA